MVLSPSLPASRFATELVHPPMFSFVRQAINNAFLEGRFLDPVHLCAAVTRRLADHEQLLELFAFQPAARNRCIRYGREALRLAGQYVSEGQKAKGLKELSKAREFIDACDSLGIFSDVGYLIERAQPAPQKIMNLAGLCWRRYMRGRINVYDDSNDKEFARIFDQATAPRLQAAVHRCFLQRKLRVFGAVVRRTLAARDWALLPQQRSDAACEIQARVRSTITVQKLTAMRKAFILLQSESGGGAKPTLTVMKHTQKGRLRELYAACLDELRVKPVDIKQEEKKETKKEDRDDSGRDKQKQEVVVGRDVRPMEGQRVVFMRSAVENDPSLEEDSGGGAGTITWVDPEDMDGDGITGDICEVLWDRTGTKGDYRTGYEGEFRLALSGLQRVKAEDAEEGEMVVGSDVVPEEGMKVMLREIVFRTHPGMRLESKGGMGTITWVDPEDADGDGATGDICEVVWDKTGIRAKYRTGFSGQFMLCLPIDGKKPVDDDEDPALNQPTLFWGERVIGIDVRPEEGMRCRPSTDTLRSEPELLNDTKGRAGTIVSMDPQGTSDKKPSIGVLWDWGGPEQKFPAADNALSLWYSPRSERAGLTLQRVFRGHR